MNPFTVATTLKRHITLIVMGSSNSKQSRKSAPSKPHKQARKQASQPPPRPARQGDARRPVNNNRPLTPQPAYQGSSRDRRFPPQRTASRPYRNQDPVPTIKAPVPRQRRLSPADQGGNRQSVYWPGLTEHGYQAALPPSFSDEITSMGASLFGLRPANPSALPRKSPSNRKASPAASSSSSSSSRHSVYYPGLLDPAFQASLPPGFAPHNLVYSALTPARPCRQKGCPVKELHSEGPYQHEGVFDKSKRVWGTCNPPPNVWEAMARVKERTATDEDREMVLRFAECHSEGYHQDWRREEIPDIRTLRSGT